VALLTLLKMGSDLRCSIFSSAEFVARFEEAYGKDAAAEIATHLK